MAATQPVLKKTRMPPKRPAMPKNPVVRSYRPGTVTRLRYSVLGVGGPWHSKRFSVNAGSPTMVFTVGDHKGRYVPGDKIKLTSNKAGVGQAITVHANAYYWEAT